jgi:hypothetical protein
MNTSETLQSNFPNKVVVFLDLDGPIIDLKTYKTNPIVSYYRTGGNSKAIENLVKLCDEFGLEIVTNSMHNYYQLGDDTLQDDLVSWGIPVDLFHSDWRTIFPKVNYKEIKSTVRGIGRLYAIEQWIKEHPGYNWICFDDRKFTEDPRLIHISRENGIDQGYYEQARKILKTLA